MDEEDDEKKFVLADEEENRRFSCFTGKFGWLSRLDASGEMDSDDTPVTRMLGDGVSIRLVAKTSKGKSKRVNAWINKRDK